MVTDLGDIRLGDGSIRIQEAWRLKYLEIKGWVMGVLGYKRHGD